MRTTRLFAVPAAVGLVVLLAACVAEHPSNIPIGATSAAQGNGQLSAQAPADGMAYVYNVPKDQIVWSGKVTKGQMIRVEPSDNRVMIDAQIASQETMMNPTDQRRIYFVSGTESQMTQTHVEEHKTTIREHNEGMAD